MAENVKIYIACHQPSPVPQHPFLFPIQVGSVLTQERFSGMLMDNTGENISEKNRSYCELTALYWAWKNDTADWQGLFHYRRYLDFRRLYVEDAKVRPYWIADRPTEIVLQKAGYEPPEELLEQLRPYEAVVPLPEEMGRTAAEQYLCAPHHHARDFRLVEELLRRGDPRDRRAAETYFQRTRLYFGNLFLMRRSLLERYCAWLFPLLEQYDREKEVSGYSPQALRVDGYLAERLLGVFLTRLQREKAAIAYVPRIHFAGLDGRRAYWKKKTELLLLPPGSTRRSTVRRILRKNNSSGQYSILL